MAPLQARLRPGVRPPTGGRRGHRPREQGTRTRVDCCFDGVVSAAERVPYALVWRPDPGSWPWAGCREVLISSTPPCTTLAAPPGSTPIHDFTSLFIPCEPRYPYRLHESRSDLSALSYMLFPLACQPCPRWRFREDERNNARARERSRSGRRCFKSLNTFNFRFHYRCL